MNGLLDGGVGHALGLLRQDEEVELVGEVLRERLGRHDEVAEEPVLLEDPGHAQLPAAGLGEPCRVLAPHLPVVRRRRPVHHEDLVRPESAQAPRSHGDVRDAPEILWRDGFQLLRPALIPERTLLQLRETRPRGPRPRTAPPRGSLRRPPSPTPRRACAWSRAGTRPARRLAGPRSEALARLGSPAIRRPPPS